jgi:hypothetical protein
MPGAAKKRQKAVRKEALGEPSSKAESSQPEIGYDASKSGIQSDIQVGTGSQPMSTDNHRIELPKNTWGREMLKTDVARRVDLPPAAYRLDGQVRL